jgi:hypothetical protein
MQIDYVETIDIFSVRGVRLFFESCFEEMKFSQHGLVLDVEDTKKSIDWANKIEGITVGALSKGFLVGLFAAIKTCSLYNHDEWRLQEFIWHSAPWLQTSTRGKIQIQVLDKALEKADVPLYICSNPQFAAVEKLLARRGFVATETVWVRR